MIYKLETYDKKVFELTDAQYKVVLRQIDTAKFLNINGSMVATAAIKELYPDPVATNERKEEERNDLKQLFGGSVAGFLESGEVKGQPKELRNKLKRIWFQHIKDRKSIDERMAPLRMKRWEEWKFKAHLSPFDSRAKKPMFLEHPPYTEGEMRIMNTPMEDLMTNYQS